MEVEIPQPSTILTHHLACEQVSREECDKKYWHPVFFQENTEDLDKELGGEVVLSP